MKHLSRRGNVLIYVLVGIALFGFLTYVVNDSTEGTSRTLGNEQAELLANQLISHAQQVQTVVQQMQITGTRIEDLDFVKPGEAGFDTPPNFNKVFHPAGGGAPIQEFPVNHPVWVNATGRGWEAMTLQNTEWTPTNASDVLYTFLEIDAAVCSKVNDILRGDSAVIDAGAPNFSSIFENNGSNFDFTATTGASGQQCANCDGIHNLCIENALSNQAFYNIIASQ